MKKPGLFPLEPSLLTLGVTVGKFGTDGGVCSNGLNEVLVPLEKLRRTNCCSRVELAESDSKEELDCDAIWLGRRTNKNLKEKWRDKDLSLTFVSSETESVAGSEE